MPLFVCFGSIKLHPAAFLFSDPLCSAACLLDGAVRQRHCGNLLSFYWVFDFFPFTGCSPYPAFSGSEPTVSGPNLEPTSCGKSGGCLEGNCGC